MKNKRNMKSQSAFQAVLQVPFLPEWETEIVAIKTNINAVYARLSAYVEQGDTIGLKPNTHTGGFSASWKAGDSYGSDAGYMLFGNAPTVAEALCVLLLKVDFLMRQDNWEQFTNSMNSGGYS